MENNYKFFKASNALEECEVSRKLLEKLDSPDVQKAMAICIPKNLTPQGMAFWNDAIEEWSDEQKKEEIEKQNKLEASVQSLWNEVVEELPNEQNDQQNEPKETSQSDWNEILDKLLDKELQNILAGNSDEFIWNDDLGEWMSQPNEIKNVQSGDSDKTSEPTPDDEPELFMASVDIVVEKTTNDLQNLTNVIDQIVKKGSSYLQGPSSSLSMN